MGFEYVYAYLENFRWICWIGLALSTSSVIFLIILRISNEIDVDDWSKLMAWTIPFVIFFGFLCGSPGMEHIKEVRDVALGQTVKIVEKECPIQGFNPVTPFYELTVPIMSVNLDLKPAVFNGIKGE